MLLTLALLALTLFWAVGAYNRLVRAKGRVTQVFAPLDAALQQRHALAGTMVSQARVGMADRHDMLDALLAARHQAVTALGSLRNQPASAQAAGATTVAEQVLGGRLDQLHATVVALLDAGGANTGGLSTVQQTGSELAAAEQKASFARDNYNAAVQTYNAAIAQFPASLLALLFGLAPAAPLSTTESAWQRQGTPVLMDTTHTLGVS